MIETVIFLGKPELNILFLKKYNISPSEQPNDRYQEEHNGMTSKRTNVTKFNTLLNSSGKTVGEYFSRNFEDCDDEFDEMFGNLPYYSL